VHLEQLKVTQFKNYASLNLTLSPRLNAFTGLNGMGKTNVLDAVHFLCMGRNHTGLNDKNLIRHGDDFFRIEGRFLHDGERDTVVARYLRNKPKTFERNGSAYERLSDYVGRFPVVMIAPDDVALVQEGSEDRRRFLDVTLAQMFPDYLRALASYGGLLKQRNALLKQGHFEPLLLEAVDRQLPGPSQVVYEHRKAFVADLEPVFRNLYAVISGDREQVSMRYTSDLDEGPLADLLPRALDKDRLLQRSTCGVHRDDVVLEMDGQAVKKFASQGQLKSFLLALRLAQYEVLREAKGKAPLLLLDDIFDKLDALRVKQLLGLLLDRGYGQLFITDTQRERLEPIVASFTGDYAVFGVEDGKVVTTLGTKDY
jgi:DNA replication and repair protein RecF